MNFKSLIVKLLILLVAGILILAPSAISHGPTSQQRAEQLVSGFLAKHGSYMALYFGNLDTAFSTLEDEPSFKELSQKVSAYQDSTIIFSHTNVTKADSFYSIYKKLNLQKDSIRIHYKPRPLGYYILHHFQYDRHPWTDSFFMDFNLKAILKVKEAIE
jgi:hypothetical protein